MAEIFRKFDAYPKIVGLDEYQTRTFTGAFVSIVAFSLMGFLFLSELSDYLTPTFEQDLFVDVSRDSLLKIGIEIVFPAIPCDLVSLDAKDVSGEHHEALEHNIYKTRLHPDGTPMTDPEKEQKIGIGKQMNETKKSVKSEVTAVDKCPSCYGAETESLKCCFDCEEVRKAYMDKGWAVRDLSKFKQCEGEDRNMKMPKEGCQIHGFLNVNRVSGSFHFAPGKSVNMGHMHIHSLGGYEVKDFDFTHHIRYLSFGDSVRRGFNTMDGTDFKAKPGPLKVDYYLKIVPTMFENRHKELHTGYKYSVTQNEKKFKGDGEGLPGIFFKYELSPLMVKTTEKSRSLGHFLTGVCAILGGIYTVASLVDAFLYHSIVALKKKVVIGKIG